MQDDSRPDCHFRFTGTDSKGQGATILMNREDPQYIRLISGVTLAEDFLSRPPYAL